MDSQALLLQRLTPRTTSYIPITPAPKQTAFILLNHIREILYGGAAGGGKSVSLLTAALQYVDMPDYSAIIFRRTYSDLSLPGALMDVAQEWLSNTDAKWYDKTKTWEFPSGATLSFGYLDTESTKYRYQSAEFQFIGFDELSQFTESQYLYLFSRLRRKKENPIPLRMRAASNPGGRGHEWVKQRFITPKLDKTKRLFIPASMYDNPHLDRAEYVESLMNLDITTREQLLKGDWEISQKGLLFTGDWFPRINREDIPEDFDEVLRSWDIAASVPKKGTDPDYTVGVKLGRIGDKKYVLDVRRFRLSAKETEERIRSVAVADGVTVKIILERDPGAAGLIVAEHYERNVLKGYVFESQKISGSKETRAVPASSQAELGNVILVNSFWTFTFVSELEKFPYGSHDDQVDAFASGINKMLTPNIVQVFQNPFYT